MDEDNIVDAFFDLFAGNPNCRGTEQGGCIEFLWPEAALKESMRDHLLGRCEPIGVYPIHNNRVQWGCIDFDEGDEESLIHARNVQLLLNEFRIVGHIERSRSKGFHVWVFGASWVVASLMREALLAACQLVDAPTKEINPKQSELTEGQVGNYVRLPYPGALKPGNDSVTADRRRLMVDPDGGWNYLLEHFVNHAWVTRATTDQLKELAHFYEQPQLGPTEPIVYANFESIIYDTDAPGRLLPLARWIYNHGPTVQMDRSSALWKLACLIAEGGRHTLEEAVALVTVADDKWGKFQGRADAEVRLEELVSKAWRDRATVYEAGA